MKTTMTTQYQCDQCKQTHSSPSQLLPCSQCGSEICSACSVNDYPYRISEDLCLQCLTNRIKERRTKHLITHTPDVIPDENPISGNE